MGHLKPVQRDHRIDVQMGQLIPVGFILWPLVAIDKGLMSIL